MVYGALVTPAIAALSACIVYMIYRNGGPAGWAFIAAALLDSPKILLLFGTENIGAVLLFSHTAGIFLFPLLLVLADILLIELNLISYLKPLASYSKTLRELLKIESVIERLQRYHAIPRPIRVARVYLVGIIAGVIHLAINFVLGSF